MMRHATKLNFDPRECRSEKASELHSVAKSRRQSKAARQEEAATDGVTNIAGKGLFGWEWRPRELLLHMRLTYFVLCVLKHVLNIQKNKHVFMFKTFFYLYICLKYCWHMLDIFSYYFTCFWDMFDVFRHVWGVFGVCFGYALGLFWGICFDL